MARKFKELRDRLSPTAQIKARHIADEILAGMPLQDLRRARQLSQQTLADAMDVPQSAVSKIEKRTDVYVSTIRKYLEAMGAELEIVALFPDGTRVVIDQFGEIGEPKDAIVKAPA